MFDIFKDMLTQIYADCVIDLQKQIAGMYE